MPKMPISCVKSAASTGPSRRATRDSRLTTSLLILVLIVAGLTPALSARASTARSLDPAQLLLGSSVLPPGAVVVHSGISDNADADGATSPDGNNNDIRVFHSASYTSLKRISGFRMRFHFDVAGHTVTTQYLASLFPTSTDARAGLADAISLISIIGSPLSPSCTAGDTCVAYAGPYGTNQIVYTAFVRGAVLVEFASAVDSAVWPKVASSVEGSLYSLLGATDGVVQKALGSPNISPTPAAAGSPTATATPAGSSDSVAAPPRKLRSYYLALGDSFSAGYLTADRPLDSQCKAPDAPGFVCVFWRYLKEIKPGVKVDNFSEPGADSCELAGEGHLCYSTAPHQNPLDPAVAFLHAHPNSISPITLTIGGNDLLSLLPAALDDLSGTVARLPGILKKYRSNLDVILSRLRTAAPGAEIIVTTQPNPFGGLGTPPLLPGLSQAAVASLNALNSIMKEEAPKYGAIVADSALAFDKAPGGANSLTWLPIYLPQGRVEIHPTPAGYRVYGETVIQASGYRLPLRAAVGKKRVKRGKTDRIVGSTTPGLTVTIKVSAPGGHVKVFVKTVQGSGAFSQSFKAGKKSGKGSASVCVSDPGKHFACAARIPFTVT